MKAILFPLTATILYAIANVVLEHRLSKYSVFTLLPCYLTVILALSIVGRQIVRTDDPAFNFPKGTDMVIIVILGVIMTAADYFQVGSYTNGIPLMTVTSIGVLFPLFTSAIKFGVSGITPNRWQLAGYAVAAVAVLLVAKGNSLSAPK